MKACEHFDERITAYVDGELRGALLEEFEAHLDACPGCRRQASAQQSVKRLVQNRLMAVQAPPQLRLDIRRLLDGMQIPRGLWARRIVLLSLRPATVYAAAAALLLCVAGAWMGGMAYQRTRITTEQASVIYQDQAGVPRAVAETLTNRTVNGRLVCIGCVLKNRLGADYDCSISGHCLGLRTEDGQLWSIVQNAGCAELFRNFKHRNQQVQVTGTVYANAHYISVSNYQIIQGD